MLTNQEVFTKAWNHAKTMKILATAHFEHGGAGCMYRTPDGKSCLIGSFIPDDKYRRGMEGIAVSNLIKHELYRQILIDVGLGDDDRPSDARLQFLDHLQRCHDRADDLKDMFDRLRLFAEDYSLIIPE